MSLRHSAAEGTELYHSSSAYIHNSQARLVILLRSTTQPHRKPNNQRKQTQKRNEYDNEQSPATPPKIASVRRKHAIQAVRQRPSRHADSTQDIMLLLARRIAWYVPMLVRAGRIIHLFHMRGRRRANFLAGYRVCAHGCYVCTAARRFAQMSCVLYICMGYRKGRVSQHYCK
jgi:hypothetical protein